MWFAIIIVFHHYLNTPGSQNNTIWTLNFWHAENEGELPDNRFVFEAGNGYGIGAELRNKLPRSVSVGDWFTIIPINEPFPIGHPLSDYPTIADVHYELGHNYPVVTVEPVGFSEKSHAEYWTTIQ